MSKSDDNEAEELTANLKMQEIQKRVEHNETVPINRLPVELFCMFLQYFDRSQLFTFESVCQKWAYFVKVFVGQKLVISGKNKVQPRYWFYLDNRCRPEAVMVRENLNVKPVANSFWFGLRQLKICNFPAKHPTRFTFRKRSKSILNDLLIINRLTALEVLEVSQLPEGTISLPKLKHLAIHNSRSDRLIIDCPQLLSFKIKKTFYGMRKFEFSHPTSITHLYLNECPETETFEQLINLQYLNMISFDVYGTSENYASRIFSKFPKLKEISLRPLEERESPFSFFLKLKETSVHPNWFVRGDRLSLVKLLEEKQALRRDDVALTFCGVLIKSEAQLDCLVPDLESYSTNKVLAKFYLENYSSLREPELRWIQVIHYPALNFPADFHKKFRYVREIRVHSQVEDENRLIEFIGGFVRLESLGVKKVAQLGVSFYKKLARCSSIPHLAIWMESSAGLANLDFLLEFKHLVCFTILQNIDDQFVRQLFAHFECFELNYRSRKKGWNIKIRRPRKYTEFEFGVHTDHLIFSQLDGFLQHIKRSDSKNQLTFVRAST